ncbi:MAG: efflux RND transporter permease subunit [Cellvibrionaceae bacterium]|nr:efflux RND transporter permease subunit [Cellvibrionaceae bacterium]
MAFTDIFVRRPILAIVVSVIIVIAGIQAMSSLAVRQYPRSDNSVVTITTAYVGASAELVRGFISTPLEQAISGAEGIDYIESSSQPGLSTIKVRLALNYDPIKALSEINSKVNQVRGELPPEAEVPIINVESADSAFASAYLSFTSDILDNNQITDFLVRVVQPRLSALEGVQRAEILGGRNFAMRIWLDPERMAAYGISPTQVHQALAANNFLSALGSTKGALIQLNVSADTHLRTVEEFKALILKEQGGAVIRLNDIADVELGSDSYDTEVRFSGSTATFMGVWPLPNANSLEVIKRVRQEVAQLQQSLPSGMEARIAYDATEYIEKAIIEVVTTLSETLIIVILVIFLFLGSVRSVMVPVIAIPVSLIGAVFLMQLFGFSLNLLTLLAIVLSVGLVVDDAIVIVENVQRHIREGHSRTQAAMAGARELIGPVISTTAVLVAVYLPIGLQGGLTGALFREFAFTLAGAVVISSIVALTLSPMMSAGLLREDDDKQGFAHFSATLFERVKQGYLRLLEGALNARGLVYFIWILTGLLCIPMFTQSVKELAPMEDQGVVFGIVQGPANATLDQVSLSAEAADQVFRSFEETDFTFQIVSPDFGFAGMVLNTWGERERSVFEIQPEVQQGLNLIPGINIFAITPPALPGGGDFPVELVLVSTAEPEEILKIAQQLQAKAASSGLFAFAPIIDTKIDKPQTQLKIDRDKVADLGLTLQQVGHDIGIMLGGNFVNRFNLEGRSYKVIPQIKRDKRLTPEQLKQLYITGPNGQLIQLSAIARIEKQTVPRSLNRFQQQNAVKLSGVAIAPLDKALTFLEEEANKLMPLGYGIDYTGESRQLRTEGNKFLPAFTLAMVLIFLVLAAQFNSFRDPFVIILGSVPLAMFGALIFTFLKMPNPHMPFWTDGWTTSLNIYSQVGLVTLIGLIAKNGILVVEFANKLQQQGIAKLDAVKQAAVTRLRPILMTSVATVAGHFPLTLVAGAGAEARNAIGLVLVGGMAIGTLFTLFVIPAVYMLLAKDMAKDTPEAP